MTLKIEPVRFKRQWRKLFFDSTPKGGTIEKLLAEETQVSETSCFSNIKPAVLYLKNCVYSL
jgi:hypothetical protein